MKLKKISSLNLIVSLVFVASLYSMRPSWLGESYSTISLLITYTSAFILFIFTQRSSISKHIVKENFKIVFFYSLFNLCILFNSFIRSLSAIEDNSLLIQGVILDSLIIYISFYILSIEEVNIAVSKIFYLILLIISVSTVISFILSFFVPASSLMLFTLANKTYFHTPAGLIFPFTLVNGGLKPPSEMILGIYFYRVIGWFREPGVLQAFLGWAFVVTPKYIARQFVPFSRILLVISALLSFSTTVIFVLPFAIGYVFFIEKIPLLEFRVQKSIFQYIISSFLSLRVLIFWLKIIIKIFITIILIISFSYYFNIDLLEKVSGIFTARSSLNIELRTQKSTASLDDRRFQVNTSLSVFLQNPFGFGKNDSKSINFLASFDVIGIQGIVSLLLMYASYVVKNSCARIKIFNFFSIITIFLTALLTQPIISSPLVVIILLFI